MTMVNMDQQRGAAQALQGPAAKGPSSPTTYELHPLCSLFPRLAADELAALAADIAANGLREPVVIHQGVVLDGGNRLAACQMAGIEPKFRAFAGEDPVAFVLSANLHRRHLSPGQQAVIVASAQDWSKAQSVGNPAFKVQWCNAAPLATAKSRAAESGASLRTQKIADKVAKADPDLARKVAHGEVSLPAAVAQVQGRKPSPQTAALRTRLAEELKATQDLVEHLAEARAKRDAESVASELWWPIEMDLIALHEHVVAAKDFPACPAHRADKLRAMWPAVSNFFSTHFGTPQ